jgi:hypothetical protein
MPPKLQNAISVAFKTANGETGFNNYLLQSGVALPISTYGALALAFGAVSNAAPYGVLQQLCAPYHIMTSTGLYANLQDTAVIQVIGSFGISYLSFPAPKLDLFVGNPQALNMSDPRMVALVKEWSAVVGDELGKPWQQWGPGWRGGA